MADFACLHQLQLPPAACNMRHILRGADKKMQLVLRTSEATDEEHRRVKILSRRLHFLAFPR
jgi:hypothetical protein